MARKARKLTGGVDTHGETHHAAVVDALGRQLADREFPTTPRGYRTLLSWLASFGQLEEVGMEGTDAYGAALSRYLHSDGAHRPGGPEYLLDPENLGSFYQLQ
jgi:transposase